MKGAVAVEAVRRDTQYPAPDALEMERSTYGKLVPLAADEVLSPVARKRLVPCATAKAISSANAATDAVSPTGRRMSVALSCPTNH